MLHLLHCFGTVSDGDSYFMSTGPVLGGLVSQDVARNTTLLLDQLLQGYDSRLRPGFGGKLAFI